LEDTATNAKHGQTASSRKTGYSSARTALGILKHLKRSKSDKTSGLPSLLIRDAHIWTKNDTTRGSILVEHGKIRRIARNITERADEEILARRLLVLPGLVDGHVHLRDMKLSYKEDFTTGTAAAAAGGFTSVIDMPNSLPPTDSAERLRERAERASGKILVNVGFHSAAVDDQDAASAMKSAGDRKSTRLNSSHVAISYAVFCLKKKKLDVHSLRVNLLKMVISA